MGKSSIYLPIKEISAFLGWGDGALALVGVSVALALGFLLFFFLVGILSALWESFDLWIHGKQKRWLTILFGCVSIVCGIGLSTLMFGWLLYENLPFWVQAILWYFEVTIWNYFAKFGRRLNAWVIFLLLPCVIFMLGSVA